MLLIDPVDIGCNVHLRYVYNTPQDTMRAGKYPIIPQWKIECHCSNIIESKSPNQKEKTISNLRKINHQTEMGSALPFRKETKRKVIESGPKAQSITIQGQMNHQTKYTAMQK